MMDQNDLWNFLGSVLPLTWLCLSVCLCVMEKFQFKVWPPWKGVASECTHRVFRKDKKISQVLFQSLKFTYKQEYHSFKIVFQ
jgi:hypothetical protein